MSIHVYNCNDHDKCNNHFTISSQKQLMDLRSVDLGVHLGVHLGVDLGL